MSGADRAADRRGDLTDFMVLLLRHRRFLVWNTAIVTVLALVISFLLPVRYRAVTALLPPQEDSDGLLSIGALMQQFDLSRLSLTGATTSAQVYLAILKSRTVADSLIGEFDLVERYDVSNMEKARKILGRRSGFKITSAGVIEISMEDRDRETAAAMANASVGYLDRLNRTLRMTEGRRTRIFIEKRLAETRVLLAATEDSLRVFQESHPGAILPADLAASAGAAAGIMAQRIAAGVELEMMRSTLRPDAAPLIRKQGEIAALDRELGTIPAQSLEIARRYRDFKIQETVFELLTAKYEDARIRELKDVTTVDVLDTAVPPIRKCYPRRGLITAIAFLLSLVTGILVAIFRDTMAGIDAAGDPRIASVVPRGSLIDRLLFGKRGAGAS